MKARAVKDWEVMYSDPIAVRAGDEVTLGKRDTEWPGWVWCTNEAGKGGWVPERIVEAGRERGRILAGYSAVELAVRIGDALSLHGEESGWYWATNEAGQSGWVPASHIEQIDGE
jgi:uncharacterized protein YgiM (DUF1202 family)